MGFVPSSFIYKQKFQQTYKYETVLLKWKAAAFSTLTVAPDCVFLDILTDEWQSRWLKKEEKNYIVSVEP